MTNETEAADDCWWVFDCHDGNCHRSVPPFGRSGAMYYYNTEQTPAFLVSRNGKDCVTIYDLLGPWELF